jgi:hypothetical protein
MHDNTTDRSTDASDSKENARITNPMGEAEASRISAISDQPSDPAGKQLTATRPEPQSRTAAAFSETDFRSQNFFSERPSSGILSTEGPSRPTHQSGSAVRTASAPQRPVQSTPNKPLFDVSAIKAQREFWTKKTRASRGSFGGEDRMTKEEAEAKLQVLARASNADLDEVRRLRKHVKDNKRDSNAL